MAEVTWSDKSMSNFNRTVDPGMEEDLRAGMRGSHTAWNFFGEVWYDEGDGVFFEKISVGQVPCGIMAARALGELMREVNERWGWE